MGTDVEALLTAWDTALAEQDRAARTRRRYRASVRSFVTWFADQNHESFAASRLTPIDLVGYRTYLQQTQRPSSVNVQIAALRSFCAWLHESRHCSVNPAARLRSVGRGQATGPKALKPAQVHALLREAQQTRHARRDYAIVQLLVQTGVRVGECAALRVCDVQLGERQGMILIRAAKGNKARSVPLNGSVRAALAEYLAERWGITATLKAVLQHLPTIAPTTSLWLSQKGGALHLRPLTAMIASLVQRCAARGLVPDDTSPHTLRHTFASSYLKDHPGDLVGLAALLGHSTLETTRIYVQPNADDLATRMEGTRLNAYE